MVQWCKRKGSRSKRNNREKNEKEEDINSKGDGEIEDSTCRYCTIVYRPTSNNSQIKL